MKIGICSDVRNSAQVAEAGADFIEINTWTIAQATAEELQEMHEKFGLADLQGETANLFIPGNIRLTGPDADLAPAEEFMKVCFERTSRFGLKIQVFGSGGARQVPDGFSKEQAFAQLVEFLKLAGRLAEPYGIQIAIEPLSYNDCNIINTVSEGLALANAVALPNVGVLADWYHMTKNEEGVAGILEAKDKLIHCHIAKPGDRSHPLPGNDADYLPFFDALKQIGYTGRISTETTGSLETIAPSIAYLRTLL